MALPGRSPQNRTVPGGRPSPGGGGRPSPGGGGIGSRRDVSESGVKTQYFKQSNFGETKNEYTMVKVTFGALIAIIAFAAIVFFFNLGTNLLIFDGILLVLWLAYFINGIRVRNDFKDMPLSERKRYWTYELSDEYRQANVLLNDFKQQLAGSSLIDSTTLVDDVLVELVTVDPLVFDFALRSAKAKPDQIMSTVEGWSSKFGAHSGIAERTGNISWRVTYPMKGEWQILDGKFVTPDMARSPRTQEPDINWNPFGVHTTTLNEVAVSNAGKHVMITGISGYGKSACLNAILKAIMEDPNDVLIVFFDAKQVEAAAISDRCWGCWTEDQARAWGEALNKEIHRRNAYLSQRGKKKFVTPDKVSKEPDAEPFSNEWPPITVVVDECAYWLTSDFKFKQLFEELLGNIARVGRSAGIGLIVAAQEAKESSIPGKVRGNVDQRIAFKLIGSTANEHAIGDYEKGDPKPSDIPEATVNGGGGIGQCCARTVTTNGHVLPVKTYYVPGTALEEAAKRTAYKKKRYRVVQAAEHYYATNYGKNSNVPFQ